MHCCFVGLVLRMWTIDLGASHQIEISLQTTTECIEVLLDVAHTQTTPVLLTLAAENAKSCPLLWLLVTDSSVFFKNSTEKIGTKSLVDYPASICSSILVYS